MGAQWKERLILITKFGYSHQEMVLDRNFEKLIGLQVVGIGINIIPVKKKIKKEPWDTRTHKEELIKETEKYRWAFP